MKLRSLAITVFITLTILTNQLSAQDIKWRWSKSTFDVSPEANTAHFIGSAFLADFLETRGMKWWQADLTAIGLGLAWEVKDGLIPFEKVPVFGSEGFSMMDAKLDIAGVVLNRVTNLALNKIIKSSKKQPKPHRIQL